MHKNIKSVTIDEQFARTDNKADYY